MARTPFTSDNWKYINGKWVELNPKTKEPFTKAERKAQSKLNQGRYPGSLEPKIKGGFASKGNVPEWAWKNVGRPVKESLQDAINMLQVSPELGKKGGYQSKFQQEGPTKLRRELVEQVQRESNIVAPEDMLKGAAAKKSLKLYNRRTRTGRENLDRDLDDTPNPTEKIIKPPNSQEPAQMSKLGLANTSGKINESLKKAAIINEQKKALKDTELMNKWWDQGSKGNNVAIQSGAWDDDKEALWNVAKKHNPNLTTKLQKPIKPPAIKAEAAKLDKAAAGAEALQQQDTAAAASGGASAANIALMAAKVATALFTDTSKREHVNNKIKSLQGSAGLFDEVDKYGWA